MSADPRLALLEELRERLTRCPIYSAIRQENGTYTRRLGLAREDVSKVLADVETELRKP